MKQPKLELLSPAGSWEALEAAVRSGADAVYLGGSLFSARANAQNFDHDTLKQAVAYCHARGVKVHLAVNTILLNHEIAPAQHEIDFHYDEAMITADNLMTFKMVVKTIAKRHGLHATFMPKPKSETYGSGMHINLSLYKNDGTNALYNAEDENGLSQEGYYFIGGLMKHMKAITCITNPTINSYKRFVPGYEAPVYMGWSAKTRGPLIRVSMEKEDNSRLELRSPDATANPYLALAVLLKAGLDGIKNQIMPPKNIDENIQKMTQERRDELQVEELPRTLGAATAELEKDELLISVLGKELAEKIIKANKKEYKEYCMQVTDWEINHYLYRL